MAKHWQTFIGGILITLTVIWLGYGYFRSNQAPPASPPQLIAAPVVPSDSVIIKALPPLFALQGKDVPFKGRTEIVLDLAGRQAGEIVVADFRASGENAHKSALRIVWADGSVEIVPAGAKDLHLTPQRWAKKLTIIGYSFHEQRVFKDVPRQGTLNWEIRYVPVN